MNQRAIHINLTANNSVRESFGNNLLCYHVNPDSTFFLLFYTPYHTLPCHKKQKIVIETHTTHGKCTLVFLPLANKRVFSASLVSPEEDWRAVVKVFEGL